MTERRHSNSSLFRAITPRFSAWWRALDRTDRDVALAPRNADPTAAFHALEEALPSSNAS
jgi:hypothetical protein